MDESDFSNPCGTFKSIYDGKVQAFVPNALPPSVDATSVIVLAAEAYRQLGMLAGISSKTSNIDMVVGPYVRREAVFSSEIEGVYASVMDVFELEAHDRLSARIQVKQNEVREVANCAHALDDCMEQINCGKKLDLKMIQRAHNMLLDNIWSQDKTPGKFRTTQNYIGYAGFPIKDASYVPPAPDMLDGLLLQLEDFLKNTTPGIPVLIQCALIHYQFEAIHPFSDGNGRVGRTLISLILADKGMLEKPLLCLSEYFAQNRSIYYAHLVNVSRHSHWTEWIKFFLTGVIIQSKKAMDNIEKITVLKSAYIQKLKNDNMSGNVIRLTEDLFANPVITVTDTANNLRVTYRAAKNIIDHLVRLEILKELGTRKRNRMYVAQDIVNMFEVS